MRYLVNGESWKEVMQKNIRCNCLQKYRRGGGSRWFWHCLHMSCFFYTGASLYSVQSCFPDQREVFQGALGQACKESWANNNWIVSTSTAASCFTTQRLLSAAFCLVQKKPKLLQFVLCSVWYNSMALLCFAFWSSVPSRAVQCSAEQCSSIKRSAVQLWVV